MAPSFADTLATLRCQSIRDEVVKMGLHGTGSRNVVHALLQAAKQAALSAKGELRLLDSSGRA